MRIFGLELKRAGDKAVETRAGLGSSSGFDDPSAALLMQMIRGAMSGSTTGQNVTPLTALGAATVFACVRVLANTLSTLPLEVLQKKGRTGVPAPEHPLAYLFDAAPNPFMSMSDLLGATQVNLSLAGRAFIEVQRDGNGDIVGLYPVDHSRVTVTIANGQVFYTLDSLPIPRSRLMHFRGLSFDGIQGLNVSYQVREAIGLALALQDNAAKFFGNGSRPGAVLEHPGSLSKEAAARLRDNVEKQTTGANAQRLLVLEEGLKFSATRSENRDSQFIESRDRQDLEICRVFGVPPHKVGIQSAQPRANVEQENLSFVSDTIRPLAVKYEQEANRVLLTQPEIAQGYRVAFYLDGLLRGDRLSRFQAYAVGRQWGWYSANDIRTLEGMSPVEGGDTYLTPANMADASKPLPDPSIDLRPKPEPEDTEDSTEETDDAKQKPVA